ncbi:hypothetical protein [Streptomyces huiliensis]|uniref:hypothetical protein n=1 Tax=Streptomyces huiliensis TaxID=2876027 RepID=UPI001CC0751D|nr:hypothetical protein [Streptomyces huiliensis]MBZ4318737.1 hypothetical protein [Streptomyces huiliensis]
MRKAAQVTGAALIAAVLMTGCSSGSGDKDDKGGKKADVKPEQSVGRSAAPSEGAKGGGSKGKPAAGSPEGVYLAQTSDGPMALSIGGGFAALVSHDGKRTCTGTVNGKSFKLDDCTDKSDKRTMGLIEKSDATSLVVFWEGGPRETFTRQGDDGSINLPGLPKLGG